MSRMAKVTEMFERVGQEPKRLENRKSRLGAHHHILHQNRKRPGNDDRHQRNKRRLNDHDIFEACNFKSDPLKHLGHLRHPAHLLSPFFWWFAFTL